MMIEIDISIFTIEVASSAAKQDKMTKSVNRNKTKLRVLCASGQSLDFEATSALMSPALPGNNMFNDGDPSLSTEPANLTLIQGLEASGLSDMLYTYYKST